MPIDFKSLKKIESRSGTIGRHRAHAGMVDVLITLNKNATLPDYIRPRSRITTNKYTAKMTLEDAARAKKDPNVYSVAVSRKLTID